LRFDLIFRPTKRVSKRRARGPYTASEAL